MALRAPFRKIVVSGREFVWKLRGNSLYAETDRHIVVCATARASCLLIDPYPWELAIAPSTVAAAIEFGLAQGWDPDRHGPPMILGYTNGAFVVLPPGARFTHELSKSRPRSMRFWELASVFRPPSTILREVLGRPEWRSTYGLSLQRLEELVEQQDREILDAPVPVELSRAVAAIDDRTWSLQLGTLRLRTEHAGAPGERVLSTLEVHDLFGGSVLEEVLDFGSARVGEGTDPGAG